VLSAVSALITSRLEKKLSFPAVHGTAAVSGIAEVLLFYLVLAAPAFLIRDSPGSTSPIPQPSTLRSWIFLALKILLVLPILKCILVAVVVINAPFLTLGFYAGCVLLFRWAFADQRQRCPVCLCLLGVPARIGTSSQTLLKWYGFESICRRGHGSLHAPGTSASYSQGSKWLDLDESLKVFRSESAGLE
jgi:hypothetical protein